MNYLTNFIYSFFATLFFSYVLKSPKKTLLINSFIAGCGYIIYMFTSSVFNQFFGYFISAMLICISCETLARIIKVPSIILLFPSVIPLVPGLGLYKMMLELVRGNVNIALHIGVETLIIILIIASSMAVTNLIFRSVKIKLK